MKLSLKPLSIKLISLLLFIIVVIIVHSCRKDIVQSGQSVAGTTLTSHDISLVQLQKAYANGIKGNQSKITDVGQQAVANIIGTLNVDWTSYTLQEFPDSTQVIEFPMPDDTTLIAPSDSIQTGNNKYRSKTCAVFILHKDTITLNFFMKTVEDLNDPSYQSVIDQQHYLNTAATFNGEIMYFTLDRQFINGYLWKNGGITKAVSIGPAQPVQQQTQTISRKIKTHVTLTNCTSDTYEVVWITTVTTPTGSYTYETPTGQSFTITTCDVVGGGTVAEGGGVSGGGVPPPPPCTTGSGGTVSSSVKSGRIIINVTTGGSGSGGTTTTTSPPCLTNPTPPVPVPPPPPDPCAQARLLAASAGFKTLMNNLKNQTAQNFEEGYTFDLSSNGTVTNPTLFQGLPNTSTVALTFSSPIDGYGHDHYAGDDPTFSGDDIRGIYQIMKAGRMNNPSTFTASVVTAAGTSYIIKISNPTLFASFGSANFGTSADFTDFLNSYDGNLLLYESKGNSVTNSYELALIQILNNSGLTLLKGNSDFSSWSILTNVNNTVTITNCN